MSDPRSNDHRPSSHPGHLPRIHLVVPVLSQGILLDKARADYGRAIGGRALLDCSALANGPLTIESDFDIGLATPETAGEVIRARANGADAAIVACFSDPGVAAATDAGAGPVVGEGRASLEMVASLSRRFSVLTTWRSCIPRIRRLVARAGHIDRLASVRAANVGVLDLDGGCMERVVDNAIAAVREDGAEAIVLGCTGVVDDMAARVSLGIEQALGRRVPVIDPVFAATEVALTMTALRRGTATADRAIAPPDRGSRFADADETQERLADADT